MNRLCRLCDEPFAPQGKKDNARVYCSNECSAAAFEGRVVREWLRTSSKRDAGKHCESCKKWFRPNHMAAKYCSPACRAVGLVAAQLRQNKRRMKQKKLTKKEN